MLSVRVEESSVEVFRPPQELMLLKFSEIIDEIEEPGSVVITLINEKAREVLTTKYPIGEGMNVSDYLISRFKLLSKRKKYDLAEANILIKEIKEEFNKQLSTKKKINKIRAKKALTETTGDHSFLVKGTSALSWCASKLRTVIWPIVWYVICLVGRIIWKGINELVHWAIKQFKRDHDDSDGAQLDLDTPPEKNVTENYSSGNQNGKLHYEENINGPIDFESLIESKIKQNMDAQKKKDRDYQKQLKKERKKQDILLRELKKRNARSGPGFFQRFIKGIISLFAFAVILFLIHKKTGISVNLSQIQMWLKDLWHQLFT